MGARVGVVLPVYNAEAYLGATLESVLGQTFEDFDLVVLDNASTDATADVVASFHDPRLTYRRNEKNLGFVGNVNLGLDLRRWDYVVVQNADDMWEPEFLAQTVAVLDREPHLSFVHTAARYVDEEGQPFGSMKDAWMPVTPGAEAFAGCFHNGFCFPAMLMRYSAVAAVGPLPSSEPWAKIADSWLFLRLCLNGDVGWIGNPLTRYRVHRKSMSLVMYADGSFFRRHLAAAADAFSWPEAKALGLDRHRPAALRNVASESIAILPSIRSSEGRGRFLRLFASIVTAVPSVALRPGTWARFGLGLLPRETIASLQAWKRRRWAETYASTAEARR